MNLVSIDLELNINQDDGNTLSSKTTDIIQIGAVVIDSDTGEIKDRFSRLCSLRTPLDNQELRLSKYIETLTGIKDSDIKSQGIDILEAYNDLIAFCTDNDVSRMPMTWGSGDMEAIRKQVGLTGLPWWFSKYDCTGFFDVKKMYQSYRLANSEKIFGGLRKAMNVMQVKLEDNMSYHNALSDAYGTAKVYYELLKKLRN